MENGVRLPIFYWPTGVYQKVWIASWIDYSKLTWHWHTAAQLHIVEENYPGNTLDVRISIANGFLLQQVCDDSRRADRHDSTLDQVRYLYRIPSLA